MMVSDDGYETDDTDELLAAKCSLHPVIISSESASQKASGHPATATDREVAGPCTIVEDEDWLFSISASSSRPASAGV
jgi:hypothetical protein